MTALQGLVINTSDADFSISSTGPFTPSSVEQVCQGHRGSSNVTPALVGNEIIYVEPLGSVVRNLIYQFSVNGFMGDNISVLSQHLLTDNHIVEMAYQQEPDSIVWAVRDDGVLLSMTYMREQDVIAWTHHDTDGLFESVAVIPNPTLGINEVWFVVNRGGTRYIERLAKRDMGTDIKNYMMLDCAITTTSSGTTVSGLSHLEGKVVNVLADGNVVKDLTVASGAITLPVAATIVHVGLPYVADMETLRIEQADNKGTTQGRKTAIPKINIRFWNSRGGYVGITSQNKSITSSTSISGLDEIPQREPGDIMSGPTPLKTRDYLFTPNGGYDFGSSIFFRQVDPLPFCITSFTPQISIGDN
jgi:hypothetical protein